MQDEAARPTFSQVIMRLRKLLHNETERLRRGKAVACKEAVSAKAPERTRGLSDPVCDVSNDSFLKSALYISAPSPVLQLVSIPPLPELHVRNGILQ
jgi:hypothetical protein